MTDHAYSTPAPTPPLRAPQEAVQAFPLPTRRAILTAPLVAAALPYSTARAATDQRWGEIAQFCRFCGPDVDVVMRMARIAGMDPHAFSGVYLGERGQVPKTVMLTFGDWSAPGAEWFRVTAGAVERVRS